MADTTQRAVAVVGVGAVLPDAPDVATYWDNLTSARYSVADVIPGRWNPALYYDSDRQAPDKTYSKIGGWVRDWSWAPLEWRLPIPPKVAEAMDRTHQWAIVGARQALADYGYPDRPLDPVRTAVVLGNAMGGDMHYMTALRAFFPEYADELASAPSFAGLPEDTRQMITEELRRGIGDRLPSITEDSMPGELANIIAGRIANLFNFNGPNFVVDAACASAMAAIDAAVEGLEAGDYDAVLTGGVDGNMSASTFIKFCKIGALSATGTRPYGDGADGFVMGEGAGIFLLKRLADAERDGDHVYAVIRGVAGSSDGKGKGITAPNPVGQELAVQRAWANAGIVPDRATYLEGHGTSTKVGDVVEVESIGRAFGDLDLPAGSIPLGSVKSNIGHLKGAAGAAGLLKSVLALDNKVIPPSIGVSQPNPNIDFAHSPLYVNTELRDWDVRDGEVRASGVSAFGFGGTNFHVVLEEYVPGRIKSNGDKATVAVAARPQSTDVKPPLRGAAVVGGADDAEVLAKLETLSPNPGPPAERDLRAEVRVAIDYGDAAELADKADKARQALESGNDAIWKMLSNQGVFIGRGQSHRVAFLYTGQGSQYVNMLAGLRETEPIVGAAFEEADGIMEPLIGRPLTDVIFVDPADEAAVAEADEQLRQTEITQPAVLTTDLALTRLLGSYGVQPDMVMGHSLGEYGALVASGAMPFSDALEAVSARGREMAEVSVDDNGLMAAVFAPLAEIRRTLDDLDGYAVVANINSENQAVIGGETPAVEAAMATLTAAGHQVVQLPVSHAFHTSIVAPAAEPLRAVLERLDLAPPTLPTVTNVTGDFYPMGPAVVPEMIDILCQQIASPVQFVDGLRTLYDAGARVFVEVGPKRALQGFAADVLGELPDVVSLYTNHPKTGDLVSFNQALCGLYAAGLGVGTAEPAAVAAAAPPPPPPPPPPAPPVAAPAPAPPAAAGSDRVRELGEMMVDFLERANQVYAGSTPAPRPVAPTEPVVVTGAALGLPGTDEVFDDANVGRILDGESFIDVLPVAAREAIVDKHITRLVKNKSGAGSFETIDSPRDVIKLAGRKGHLDLVEQFGIAEERQAALDPTTELAIGSGMDALRDAGIPLTMLYKTATTGAKLPEGWGLPPALRDDTGVIFASAFPGYDRLVDEVSRYEQDRGRHEKLEALQHLRERLDNGNALTAELDHMIHETRADIERDPYVFDRRFIFKTLSMGHSQFAEHIGARGPNTQVNAACASTTQAVTLAEDWIRAGRCRRVVIISGDDVTSDSLVQWIGAGFLASGAAATDEVVEEAALPFDRRRHGMIVGMGGAAIVVESADAARERGVAPICEVLSGVTANSAFHGSRLDVSHIREVMEDLVASAEQRWGIDRMEIAPATVFVSHETYTPARGGSAQAEVDALRHVFGDAADQLVVANTKGFTGHAMGVGIEDVVAIKSLETGVVPPIANVKEVDPELGHLNLSKGGAYPIRYALRLGAGFGSQISMSLMRWVPTPDGARRSPDQLGYGYRVADQGAWSRWLESVSGYDAPVLEIEQRTLRFRDDGPPTGVAPRERPVVATAPPVLSPPPVVEPEPVALPEPAPEPEPVAAAAAPVDDVVAAVIGIVAQQTGYPADMLDTDLDLEADLGIDTVKQAETFAAIREHYDIERDDTLSLRDYPTLNHVIGFVNERRPQTTQAQPATEEAEAAPTEAEEAAGTVPRRLPRPVMRPDLDLCKPTGVELGAGSRVVVGLDEGGVGSALVARLEKRDVDVLAVDSALPADEIISQTDAWRGDAPIHGVYWLPALDTEPEIGQLDLDGWRAGLTVRAKSLYRLLRHLYEPLGERGAFVVAATRLGGFHGYGPDGACAPMGGAVVGLAKAFKRERPEALVKAVDFAPSRKTAALADRLVEETLRDPGTVEIGYPDERRITVAMSEEELPDNGDGLELGPDSVFVVTGAAGSIVSAIVDDLARASGGTFHLLDLAPEPDPDDPDIRALVEDREALMRTLFERIKATGERATPAAVEKQMAGIERAHAALSAIQAVTAAGGTARYHSVNLLDGEAMADVTASIRETSGKVDVLIHAAGLEISRLLPDKEPAEYDLVFDVKADGWFNLMRGLGELPIGATVAFSSIAGRFGNAGQTDYSAANDLLCKLTSNLRTTRPDTTGLVVDWTAWADIGMASRGSIPTVMAAAGIDMLAPAIGIPLVRRELTADTTTREVLVAGRLGVMAEEFDPTGGLDVSSDGPLAELTAHSPLVGQVSGMPVAGGLTLETTLDPTTEPFLDDHRIDDRPVLPGVMGIESFAEAARLLFPGWHVAAVENVDFLAPFKFYRDEPRSLKITAQPVPDGDDIVVACRLVGERALANQDEPQVTVHFTGDVRLTTEQPTLPEGAAPAPGEPSTTAADIYRIYFHGPAYQVVDRAWTADGEVAGLMAGELPPNHDPAAGTTLTHPRLLELCFQTAGVWEIGTSGTMALPLHVDRVVHREGDGPLDGPVHAVVRPNGDEGFDALVVDAAGAALVEMRGYRTVALPEALADEVVQPLRAAMESTT